MSKAGRFGDRKFARPEKKRRDHVQLGVIADEQSPTDRKCSNGDVPLILVNPVPEMLQHTSKRVAGVSQWHDPKCCSRNVDAEEERGRHARHSTRSRNREPKAKDVAGKQEHEYGSAADPVLNSGVFGMFSYLAFKIEAAAGAREMEDDLVRDRACEGGGE